MIELPNDKVIFHKLGSVGFILLNRPAALNALDQDMLDSINKILEHCLSDPSILSIVIEGEGRAFCAGGDIVAAYREGKNSKPPTQFFRTGYLCSIYLNDFPKAYLSILDGIVMGGGVGISIYGKYRIVTENTLFAMPEAAIGFFTDIGAAYFTKDLPLAHRLYICLTGARLNAADCINFGFATHYINSASAQNLKEKLATIASPNQIEDILKELSIQPEVTPCLTSDDFKIIDDCFNANSVSGILENLFEYEQKGYQFAKNTRQTLLQMSPMSLLIIFYHIVNGKYKNLAECMKTEFRITYNMLSGHDFYEGVRAVLIDKDKSPKWQYNSIEGIDSKLVESYFSPIKDELCIK